MKKAWQPMGRLKPAPTIWWEEIVNSELRIVGVGAQPVRPDGFSGQTSQFTIRQSQFQQTDGGGGRL